MIKIVGNIQYCGFTRYKKRLQGLIAWYINNAQKVSTENMKGLKKRESSLIGRVIMEAFPLHQIFNKALNAFTKTCCENIRRGKKMRWLFKLWALKVYLKNVLNHFGERCLVGTVKKHNGTWIFIFHYPPPPPHHHHHHHHHHHILHDPKN